jgi:hypothetical protein
MTHEIEQQIEQLKTAQTGTNIAHATVKLLRACGVYNFQGVAQEMARMSVTGDLACEKKQWANHKHNVDMFSRMGTPFTFGTTCMRTVSASSAAASCAWKMNCTSRKKHHQLLHSLKLS